MKTRCDRTELGRLPRLRHVAILLSILLAATGALPASSSWTRQTFCIGPDKIGTSATLSLWILGGGDTSCGTTYAQETVWYDDVEVTTDPSCPASP